MKTMSNREFAKHIYDYVINSQNNPDLSPSDTINYIGHLMDLHYENDNHLGSKGFESTSKIFRTEFGC